MLKKILTLSLVAVMLSVTAFADLSAIDVYAEANFDAAITNASQANASIDDVAGLTGSVALTIDSDVAASDAIVVTAVFDETTFLNASITPVALEVSGSNTATIALPTAKTLANDSYDVKFYLWESKTTLEPLAQPYPIEVVPAQPSIAYWDGKPSDAAPKTTDIEGVTYYQISNGAELAWFSKNAAMTANAILTDDIYLNSNDSTANNWAGFQIGSDDVPFTGIFDGNGKKIINYYENSSGKYSGLFEVINGATIKNLTLENAKVEWGYGNNATGFGSVVCGRANGSSTFNNVHVSGSAVALSDKYFVGFGSILGFGGAGTSNRLAIVDCSSSVNIDSSASTMAPVSGETYIGVGGIVGMSERNTTLTNCTNSGTINAPKGQNVGGIMGNARRNSNKFVSCTNTVNITGYVTAHAIASGKPTIDATCNAGGIVTVIPAS